MKIHTTLMASCALAVMGVAAHADCAEELAMITGDAAQPDSVGAGISKDGSLAPLEEPETAGAAPEAGATSEPDASANGAAETSGSAMDAGEAETTDAAMSGSDTETGADDADTETGAATDATAAADTGTAGEGISKDGSLAPLEENDGASDNTTAMSGDDAQAQQEGEPTAAAEAEAATSGATETADGGAGSERDEIVERATKALADGDEGACMAAVEELKAM